MMSHYARNSVFPMQKLLDRQSQPKRHETRKNSVAARTPAGAGSWKTSTILKGLPKTRNGRNMAPQSQTSAAMRGRAAPPPTAPSSSQPPRSVSFEDDDPNELSQLTLSQSQDSLPSGSSVPETRHSRTKEAPSNLLRLGQDSLSVDYSQGRGSDSVASRTATVVSSSSSQADSLRGGGGGGRSVATTRSRKTIDDKLKAMVHPPWLPRPVIELGENTSVAPSVRVTRQRAMKERQQAKEMRARAMETREPRAMQQNQQQQQQQLEQAVLTIKEQERSSTKLVQEEGWRICSTAEERVREQERVSCKSLQELAARQQESLEAAARQLENKEKSFHKCLETATKQHSTRERELDSKASKIAGLIDVAMKAQSQVTHAADSTLAMIADARDDFITAALPYLVDPVTKFVRNLVLPVPPVSMSDTGPSKRVQSCPVVAPLQDATNHTPSPPCSEKKPERKRKEVTTPLPRTKPSKRQCLAQDNVSKPSEARPGRATVKPSKTQASKKSKSKQSQLQPLTLVDTNVTRPTRKATTKSASSRSPMSLKSTCVTPSLARGGQKEDDDDMMLLQVPVSPVSSKKRKLEGGGLKRGRRKTFRAVRKAPGALTSDSYGFLSDF